MPVAAAIIKTLSVNPILLNTKLSFTDNTPTPG
jgi:hypothetical protein